jgi:hypothetical protein
VTKAYPAKAGDAKLRDYSDSIAMLVEPPSEPLTGEIHMIHFLAANAGPLDLVVHTIEAHLDQVALCSAIGAGFRTWSAKIEWGARERIAAHNRGSSNKPKKHEQPRRKEASPRRKR